VLALWSQPTAEVLSPKDKKQELGGAWWFKIVNQTVMIDAKNSKELFLFCTLFWYFSGIFRRQASP
jgi:hypothetical protein